MDNQAIRGDSILSAEAIIPHRASAEAATVSVAATVLAAVATVSEGVATALAAVIPEEAIPAAAATATIADRFQT
jgi:nicotinamide mononucleotide (NMN) deamidase PncC